MSSNSDSIFDKQLGLCPNVSRILGVLTCCWVPPASGPGSADFLRPDLLSPSVRGVSAEPGPGAGGPQQTARTPTTPAMRYYWGKSWSHRGEVWLQATHTITLSPERITAPGASPRRQALEGSEAAPTHNARCLSMDMALTTGNCFSLSS